MSNADTIPQDSALRTLKPRLVLMGEFSAGKSTLSNILLGSNPLPMRVTATRLPPVKISHGAPGAFAVGKDGRRSAISLEDLEAVSLDETRYIELTMESEALTQCDLVDMPGISDPNMPQNFWEDVVGRNDHVIWCTHATQAWRQSEAAIWNILQPLTSGTNLLLITQYDKLQNDRDKRRVLHRVQRETEGLFDAVYPVSLLEALNAGDNFTAWTRSGAAAFFDHVAQLVAEFVPVEVEVRPVPEIAPTQEQAFDASVPPHRPTGAADNAEYSADSDIGAASTGEGIQPSEDDGRIVPRRVRLGPTRISRERPEPRAVAGFAR